MRHGFDASIQYMNDRAMILMASPGSLKCSKQGDEEQPSSGDPTPASEAWEYWEEIPELCGYNIDGETLLEAFTGALDALFRDSSAPSSSAVRSNHHQQRDPKRKRAEHVDIEDADARPNKLRITEKRSRKLTPLHKSLACPYFKKDSRRHGACRGFGFTKISYMKAHIYRKHAIRIYCEVCQQPFENVQLRDNHSRERNCDPIENVQAPDGITSEQRDWLHQRGPRNFSEEEQWFRIFEFLFPGHPRPRSPYNDTTFSEDLLNFRDFISGPTAQEILFQRVRENSNWTPGLEAIFRPDLVHGLDQLYWRWAGREHGGSQAAATTSPSRETGAASTRSTNEGTTLPESQPETSLCEGSALSPGDIGTHEAPTTGATSATAQDQQEDEEPRLDSAEALAFADYELEERKVDEADQPPPRQLNHDGIALVPEQELWPPADFSETDHADYDSLALPNDFGYGLSTAGDAFFSSLDDIEGAEDWGYNFDLLDYEASLPMRDPEHPPADESPVDVRVTETGGEPDIRDEESTDSGNSDDFIIIAQSSD